MLTLNTFLEGRYRIVRKLGEGGMGVVYEAIDERLKSLVAIKETVIEDDQMRRAFEREAGLLANLRHPSLPTVRDHFAEDNRHFLVMEFIPGDDLARLLILRGRAFSQADVLQWGDDILKVLEYLHKYNPPILHRDIKPANLKLTEQGELFLLDFGLAKGAAGQMATLHTNRSVRAFTPVYAPLEQIHGVGTDPRSDLYALGTTLYHLLTGVTPTDAPTRFTLVEDGQPDPLRPATEVNPQVSSAVSAALSKAMAVSRNQRFATATELRIALREAVSSTSSASDDEESKALAKRPTSAQPLSPSSEPPTSSVAAPTAPAPVPLSDPETLALPESEQQLSSPRPVKNESETEIIPLTIASPTQKSEDHAIPTIKSLSATAALIELPEKAGAVLAIPPRKSKWRQWLVGSLILALMVLMIVATNHYFMIQTARAVVEGRVLNSLGEGVPNAKIILQEADDVVVMTRTTDSSGAYRLYPVKPGDYMIVAEAYGTKIQQSLTVNINTTAITPYLQFTSAQQYIGREGFASADVYLRAEPSKDSPAIGIAEKGSRLRVLSVKENWYEVEILEHGRTPDNNNPNAERGWAIQRFVTLAEQSAPASNNTLNQSSPAPDSSPISTNEAGGKQRSSSEASDVNGSGADNKAENENLKAKKLNGNAAQSKASPANKNNSQKASADRIKRIRDIFEGNP